MSQLALLVIDGTPRPADGSAFAQASETGAAQVLIEALDRLCPQATVVTLRVGDRLPTGMGFESCGGILWTGTGASLSLARTEPFVRQQVEIMRVCCQAGVPVFGSGWGLHVAAVALGGDVTQNSLRREFPFARKIHLTQAGVTHPLFQGRSSVFDALSLQQDMVEALPFGSQILAHNRSGGVQAVEIPLVREQSFFGLHYLPEYDLREMAAYATAHQHSLIAEGLFADQGQAAAFSRRCIECQVLERSDLLVALGVDDDILRDDIRQNELAQWLRQRVLPQG